MRTRNALERLALAGRPLFADAESLIDAAEQERILERIVASEHPAPHPARSRRAALALALALAGVALLVAAAVVASLQLGGGNRVVTGPPSGHQQVVLTGAKIQLAGYHFRTPAGFADSNSPCTTTGATGPFSAAASADGGCVEAFFMLNKGPYAIAPGAQSIDVGGRQGYVVTTAASTTLYVAMPKEGEYSPYLMLVGKGLTTDQLVAIAESGLTSLFEPTATTGTEGGG